MVAEIPLTRGFTALIDDDVFERASRHSWCADSGGRHLWYAASRISGRLVRLHHFVLGRPPRGFDIDHVDGNGLNNQRANLRVATRADNLRNQRKRSAGTSPFKGVSIHQGFISAFINSKATGRNTPFRIGNFSTEVDAAKAYDACARLLYGEHACVNFPRAGEQSAHAQPLGGLQEKTLAQVEAALAEAAAEEAA